jgi:hypothetical protein
MNGAGVLMLVDSGSTQRHQHHRCLRLGLQEQRINTTILVGSENEVPCRGASLNIPLHIRSDAFDIDAFLLDIGNEIDMTWCWAHLG